MNATTRSCDRVSEPVPARSAVLEALRRHRGAYVAAHGGDPRRLAVLHRLLTCRTAAAGTHLQLCTSCGWHGYAYNSCRDRHCPQCQAREAAAWADAAAARMLDVPHFQVVFTLPEDLRPLAHLNPDRLFGLLFSEAACVLQQLAADRLGGRLGITAVLHTWTSELTYHPHVHLLVTAGALGADDTRWVPSRDDFLFPARVMGALFRGRVLAAILRDLDEHVLVLPAGGERAIRKVLARLATRLRRWVVHVEPPKGRPVEHVTRYLARYVKRVAVSDGRILGVTDTQVRLQTRRGVVELGGAEFVRRFLLHVLPKDFRKVRHYGLYAPGGAKARRERAAELVGAMRGRPDDGGDGLEQVEPVEEPREACPSCGEHAVVRVHPDGGGVGRMLAMLARGPP